jgi:hypothetical protein
METTTPKAVAATVQGTLNDIRNLMIGSKLYVVPFTEGQELNIPASRPIYPPWRLAFSYSD